jgi:Flp pilus assembly CpaE family ATPase
MLNNGAKGTVTLPMDDQGIATFLRQVEPTLNEAWRDRAEGRTHFGPAFGGAGDGAYERKTVAVWVPKGGGSTRTTLATNLAVALAHARFGGRPTVLADLDMSKGDCHTLLGYTVDAEEAARYRLQYLDWSLHTLITRAALHYPQRGDSVMDAVLINRYLTHWRPGESQLKLLPGLTSPAQAASEEFQNWQLLYDLIHKLLRELQRMGAFVICDLGQDFTVPLHRAALELADEVLVPVPPARTAIVDTIYALPALKHQLGDLAKFKLVITAYDPGFGIDQREIVRAVGLPLLTVLPHDAVTAHRALNNAEPFVLTDSDGPLGSAVIELAAIYYPGLQRRRARRGGVGGFLKRLVVRET